MSITYSAFFPPTVLTTTAATLYTVATTPTTNLLRGGRVRLTNTTGSAVTATLYAVPNLGVAGVGNAFVSALSIAANSYLDVDVPIMGPGATLQALAGSNTSLTIHMLAGSIFS